MRRWALAFGLLVSAPALAEPLLVPSGDVEAVYRVTGAAAAQIPGGAPGGVRLQWDAAGQRLRAEAVGQPTYAITDLPRREELIVFAQQSGVLVLPLRAGDPQALLAGADVRFTRRGANRVAGLECTDWAVHGSRVNGTGCVTADGIVLRAAGTFDGQAGAMEAVSVERRAIPAGQFEVPANFFRLPLGKR